MFTKNNSDFGMVLRRVQSLAKRIKDPVDFYAGIPIPEIELPKGILMFSRQGNTLEHPPMANLQRFVLLLSLRGHGVILLDNLRLHLKSNQGVLIFPGQFHSYVQERQDDLLWLFITFQLTRPQPWLTLKSRSKRLSETTLHYTERLVADYLSPNRHVPSIAGRMSVTLWLLLQELAGTSAPREPLYALVPSDLKNSQQALVAKVQAYILEHLQQSIHIADLARVLVVSPSSMCSVFRQTTRMTLGKYIRRERIRYACELMSTTDYTLSQIANQCGFVSLYDFSRTFKKVKGVSPKRYRLQLRKT